MTSQGFDVMLRHPSLMLPAAYQDAPVSIIFATLLLAILLPVCIALWLSFSTKSRRKSKTVLLLGPSGAGKTALYTKLLFGAARPTQTSLVENQSAISYKWTEEPTASAEPAGPDNVPGTITLQEPFTLIDTPGHPRLRARAVAKHLAASTHAILLIDSTTGLTVKNIRTAADSLHMLLGLRSFLPSLQPLQLLILLTKADPAPVLIERARLTLGREMERRRQAALTGGSSNRIEGLAAEDGPSAAKGGPLPTDENEILQADIWGDKPWSWDQELDLGGIQVSWATAHLGETNGAQQVYQWAAQA